MPIKENSKAPDFTLPSSTGEPVALKDFVGKQNVVLYFYPKDMTPGCTQEACDFRDLSAQFKKMKTAVIGISADSPTSHQKFIGKWKLPFLLLSDESKEMLKKYGVWKQKSLYGHNFMGIERTTMVIDEKGKIRKIFPKVKVKDHAKEVLNILKDL